MVFSPSTREFQRLLLRCAGLLWLAMTATAFGQIQLGDYTSAQPLKIMAIGDSITDDCSYNGAWRQFLQPFLQSNGYAFSFVGRQRSAPSGLFTQTRHEGYCGSVIAAPGVLSYSVHNYPGTAVYLQRSSRMRSLISRPTWC